MTEGTLLRADDGRDIAAGFGRLSLSVLIGPIEELTPVLTGKYQRRRK
jgi:hypothetical protein